MQGISYFDGGGYENKTMSLPIVASVADPEYFDVG
jgi:hypothetical protein